jgi:hypothetical protein
MGNRNRRGTATRTALLLAVPLAAVTAVALALAEVTPAAADSSATAGPAGSPAAKGTQSPQGLLPSLLPSLLPTSLPSILPTSLPLPSLPSLPLPSPSLPGILLPTPSASPSGTGSAPSAPPQPTPGSTSGSSSAGASPTSAPGVTGAGHAGGSRGKPAASRPGSGGLPVSFSADAPPPAVALLPANPVGYALPVPASVVAADPALIGEGASAPRQARAAGPVTIDVPAGTEVDAVTAGAARAVPAGNGTSVIVLSGADGATYTYRDVTAALPARKTPVGVGTRIGASAPGGLTFSITVPDVHGPVDADEAMQGWASGLSPNVRALPSGIASSVAAPARDQVLLVTPPANPATAGSPTASALAQSLAGPLVKVRDVAFGAPAAREIAAAGAPKLTIAALPGATPAQAARLAALLPAGHELLWVAAPGTTAKQARAYLAIVAARPGFRVESLPAALTTGKKGAAPASDLAAATLIAAYASTAYRLRSVSSQANAVLSWAEARLGEPAQPLAADALAQAGIGVPPGAAAQWRQTRSRPVAESRLAPGDLVFFGGSGGTPTRVGIYAGDGEIIDTAASRATVRLDPLSGISGYTGSADPYAPVPESALASGLGSWLTAPVAALTVPGALGQYQQFARQLSDSTWGPSQFPYLYELWERESGWNPAALNPVSGAFGIPQSLPAGKMAAAGPDWASDPYTQIIWGIGYIGAAYGDPQAAWAHEVDDGWY